MQHDFFWFGMKKDIKAHIKTCEVCQRIKVDTSKSIGLLQPLPILVKPWLDISMNFISSLPKSHGFEIILWWLTGSLSCPFHAFITSLHCC